MKKAVKVLLGIVTAGASASAAALAVKKYRDSRKKYICDECEEDYSDDFDDEYHLSPEEEEELVSTDDHDFGTSDDDYYLGMCDGGASLDEEETDFVRYLLDGINNVGYLMNSRYEDIERICRRRNITATEKFEQIRAICQAGKENYELIGGCIEDIKDIIDGKYPDDYWEFHFEQHKEEDEDDAE